MNCYDAILQNDAREVFVLDNKTIKQFSEMDACITPMTPVGSNTQYITVFYLLFYSIL